MKNFTPEQKIIGFTGHTWHQLWDCMVTVRNKKAHAMDTCIQMGNSPYALILTMVSLNDIRVCEERKNIYHVVDMRLTRTGDYFGFCVPFTVTIASDKEVGRWHSMMMDKNVFLSVMNYSGVRELIDLNVVGWTMGDFGRLLYFFHILDMAFTRIAVMPDRDAFMRPWTEYFSQFPMGTHASMSNSLIKWHTGEWSNA